MERNELEVTMKQIMNPMLKFLMQPVEIQKNVDAVPLLNLQGIKSLTDILSTAKQVPSIEKKRKLYQQEFERPKIIGFNLLTEEERNTLNNQSNESFLKKQKTNTKNEAFLQKYPRFENFITSLDSTIEIMRQNKSKNPDILYELELRLGSIINNKFNTGITRELWEHLLEKAESFEDWHSINDFETSHIMYYTISDKKKKLKKREVDSNPNINPMSNVSMRSVVTFKKNKNITRYHIVKSAIRKHDIKCNWDSKIQQNKILDDKMHFDFRVALSSEKEFSKEMPAYTETNRVSIRERKTFYCKDTQRQELRMWAFEFSVVWSGKTMTEVEQNQYKIAPEYHFELELVEPEIYLKSHDNFHVACSMLLKILNFLTPSKVNNNNNNTSIDILKYIDLQVVGQK